MAVRNLQVEKWDAENVTYINRLTKQPEFTKKIEKRERWTWMCGGRQYRTDVLGEGMWSGDKQLTGTSQFSLRGYSLSGARKKLNRRFSEDDE